MRPRPLVRSHPHAGRVGRALSVVRRRQQLRGVFPINQYSSQVFLNTYVTLATIGGERLG
jgi:hypothetical protein